jgi:2-polyprenyl-3-methyl-5-hydroxy-6-metoxy-1,4-benzoquinol methylase
MQQAAPILKCRHCAAELTVTFADLGATPVANDYLASDNVSETYYPLRAYVCEACRLVQLQDFKRSADLFADDYAYFSSVSTTWLDHARRYADAMEERFKLDRASTVVEIASNDGYLLQYFKVKGVRVLGIEPSRSVAEYAIREKSIPTKIQFFGRDTAVQIAAEGFAADLIAANNVLAHVPDINDFVAGCRELLKPDGVVTFEFPHLRNLILLGQFDTIYHEHFSYISLLAAERILATASMKVFDVEEISTHGGSLRVFACRATAGWLRTAAVDRLLAAERAVGLDRNEIYGAFAEKVRTTKRALLTLLIGLKREGRTIVGYGAPAKGNTLLNYCGIGRDMLDFTVDRSPHKQGKFLPGSRLPIRAPEEIDRLRPDIVMILPWNIKEEIIRQMAHIRAWGGRFVVPIPTPQVID